MSISHMLFMQSSYTAVCTSTRRTAGKQDQRLFTDKFTYDVGPSEFCERTDSPLRCQGEYHHRLFTGKGLGTELGWCVVLGAPVGYTYIPL